MQLKNIILIVAILLVLLSTVSAQTKQVTQRRHFKSMQAYNLYRDSIQQVSYHYASYYKGLKNNGLRKHQ